ncbi:hypothetical protein EYZ11_007306 [Aspergillus tanneri]|uniref:Rhodanese domain-containing protein n=1 Tax=Aspergillus tanneri TaxID=1220188 RepID=A0A4V3UP08_9EURO|nr:hypothetical protein EYZ11_007306 [Aspergillus tanneri]
MDTIRNTTSKYPFMLPSGESFSTEVSKLGITPSDTVVIYDAPDVGTYNAPRVAWMFRVFGHGCVHVLNNFRGYCTLGFPVTRGIFSIPYCGDEVQYENRNQDQNRNEKQGQDENENRYPIPERDYSQGRKGIRTRK